MNSAVVFAQGFLDIYELSAVRAVCREWRDNLAEVFAYEVNRVFTKLDGAARSKAIAFAKHIDLDPEDLVEADQGDQGDLVQVIQTVFLHGAPQLPAANIEELVCCNVNVFEGYASTRNAFHARSLLRHYTCRKAGANEHELVQLLVEKKLVMIAHDAPKQVVVDCLEFMTRIEHSIWMCATLDAILNSAIGMHMLRNDSARYFIRSHLVHVIEDYADNVDVVKVAEEINKKLE